MNNNRPESKAEANEGHPEQANNKSDFLICLSDFFKRDLITIPVVKKYPHAVVQQRCGLRAATLELDTAAYPNIEYVAGTRLSVYPINPSAHVSAIMEHLHDDLWARRDTLSLPPSSAWWSKFVHLHKSDSLRLALAHLFDIEIAPSREIIRLLLEYCLPGAQQRDLRRRLAIVANSNEAWEKWLCSGHRTLKLLFDEIGSTQASPKGRQQPSIKLPASRLLAELELQTPRQYSISNIKSSKRFRTEIIVFQHKFGLRQIELNLKQQKEREDFDRSSTSPKSPSLRSTSVSGRSTTSPIPIGPPAPGSRRGPSAARRPGSPASGVSSPAGTASQVRNVAESSRRSGASVRSIRSLTPFATSPPISTHQVKRVPSFSGPLMSMYAAAATSSQTQQGQAEPSTSGTLDQAAKGKRERMRSRMSLVSAPETNFSDPAAPASPSSPAGAQTKGSGSQTSSLFEGLCSSYLLNLSTNDHIVCEFVENPRFTLKGNRERPIMMIGQDVGLIAFRPFWQQRNLEHDRAQVFYTLFKDLSPKKFGEMQLVCVTGHRCRIEELLFRREINLALTSKVLSSVTYINRKHLVNLLKAAHTKSQLVFAQYSSTARSSAASGVGMQASQQLQQQRQPQQQQQQQPRSNINNSLQITEKELLDLGERMYKLLVEHTGCLYTCCDPHMTQAIEILLFESIAGRNPQLTRERVTQLLPKWKGKDSSASGPGRSKSRSKRGQQEGATQDGSIFTLENTYERARIVQEIYDNTI